MGRGHWCKVGAVTQGASPGLGCPRTRRYEGPSTRADAWRRASPRAAARLLDAVPFVVPPIDAGTVVVDAKSGVSGAGRGLKPGTHAGFVLENLSPYRIGTHQHVPEIAQVLGFPVCFVPHLLPVRRGLLATCYVQTDADVRALLAEAYAGSPVVRILPDGTTPELGVRWASLNRESGTAGDRVAGAHGICSFGKTGIARLRLRRARTHLDRYVARLNMPAAQTIPSAIREPLVTEALAIAAEVAALRAGLACPIDA